MQKHSSLGVRRKSSFLKIDAKGSNDDAENYDGNGENWWEVQSSKIAAWLRSNPLKLGIDHDAVSLIQRQLKRGSDPAASQDVKVKCWAHIVVEFEGVPGNPIEAAPSRELLKSLVQSVTMVPALKPSAPSPMPSPAASPLPPMPVPVQSESSGAKTPENSGARRRTFEDQMDAASKILRPEITESSHPVKKKLSEMTMLERNQYFLEKKREKQRLERERIQRDEEQEIQLAAQKREREKVRRRSFSRRISEKEKEKDAAKKARRSSLLDDCKNLLGGTSAKDITAEQKPKKSKVATVGKRRKTTSSLPPRSGKSKKRTSLPPYPS